MCGNNSLGIKYTIISSSIQGASHKLTKAPNQDNYKIVESSNAVIIAVADGHGSSTCLHSKKGSAIAVRVFTKILADLISEYEDIDSLKPFLLNKDDKLVAQTVEKEWKRRVIRSYRRFTKNTSGSRYNKEDKKNIWMQYGTTLLGLVMTSSFIYAFQLGDGDIVISDDLGAKRIIESDGLLGTDTYSLSGIDACKCSKTVVLPLPDTNSDYSIMLVTDGFANSYNNDNIFLDTVSDYHNAIKEHGAEIINANLKSWLKETSAGGSGDDITMVIVYIKNN